ncbi:hypothetical protein HNQ44_000800 [Planomicrobium koreense]|uniref:SLH domain-containing protein n=1 Tax=Planococcus koreensis TaxID=112331 RepID=A0A7W8CPU4_9BACL|nr:S-layer homology domain-containing protein [Planococcus koreensis]MBB5179376.1 hypothetical protein [Planococcus koreensis]
MNIICFLEKIIVSVFIFLLFLLVIFSNESFAEEEVSVTTFGATGTAEIDETDFIQKAINFQSARGGGTVHIPKGIYLIDAIKSIVLRDNINLEFEKGAILQAIPNNEESYEIIRIHNVKNVGILGSAELVGERGKHTGTTGEWGFGVSIKGSNNIMIENIKISDCWGDGIYIGSTSRQKYSKNIKILNPILNNNRRQGISIISAINLYIYNAVITNTNGTPPQSGLDIEPNYNTDQVKNINIINLATKNNIGYGLIIGLGKLKGSPEPVSIYIDKIGNIKDRYAVKGTEGLNGNIKFGGYYYLTDKEIVSKPIVKEITNNATQVKGKASTGLTISARTVGKIIGTAKVNGAGEFAVPIVKQKAGTQIEIFASDKFGNKSTSVISQVKVAKYSDFTSSHWAYLEVNFLSDKKILTGIPDGRFLPEKNATRAEAAKMLAVALNLQTPKANTIYKDVSSSHWARDYIVAASKSGLFNGYPDGSFKPEQVLTRAEMSKLLVKAYNLVGESSTGFSDVSNSWAKSHILTLVKNGITTGFPDDTFKPNIATTRAQFSAFLARSMDMKFREN